LTIMRRSARGLHRRIRSREHMADRKANIETGCLRRDVAEVRGGFIGQGSRKGTGQDAVMGQGNPVARPSRLERGACGRRICGGRETKLWTNLRTD
jgi:hypothetical protein